MIRAPEDWDFMVDQGRSTQDALTARFPRTTREAFGHYDAVPMTHRITFLQRPRAGWLGLLAAVAVVAFFVITGAPK